MGVRKESVELSLRDVDFSTGMAKAAAQTRLLQRELNELDGTTVDLGRTSTPLLRTETDALGGSVGRTAKKTKEYTLELALADERSIRFRKSLRDQARAMLDVEGGLAATAVASRTAGADIDRLSGRLALFAKLAAVLGPSLIPIGALAVPAVAGLASQLGFAVFGMGSLVVASRGVGDALSAVNDAALEPTAENLEKARAAMAKIGPEAREFVDRFQELRPVLGDIRDAAAAGWFPGLTESLDHLEEIAPRVASIFEAIGTAGGDLVADGAEALTGPQWLTFLQFVEANAPQALDELGRTVGNVTRGLAELWMAFDPLNDDFSQWMLDGSRGFAEWADGLSQTEGFAEFVGYIRTNGPKVADALVAIGNALLQIVEAAAPIAGPVLEALTSFADTIAAIADSPLGTPIMAAVTAMSALSLATGVANAAVVRLNASMAMIGVGGKGGKAGALGAGAAGGPVGLAAVATILGITQSVDSMRDTVKGEQGLGEGFLKALVPAITTLDSLGLAFWETEDAAAAAAKSTAEFQRHLSGDGWNTNGFGQALYGPLAETAEQAEIATAEVEDLRIEFERLLGVLSQQGEWDAYQAAIDGATASAKEHGRTLHSNTDAGRANRAALNDVTKTAIEFADNLTGMDRIQFLKNARRSFVAAAEDMGGLDRRARNVLAELDKLIGVRGKPRIDDKDIRDTKKSADDAKAAIDRVDAAEANPWVRLYGVPEAEGQLAKLTRPRQISIVAHMTRVPLPKGSTPQPNSIPQPLLGPKKERYVGGFTGRGGKYEPAGIVHRGEVVIPQELVARDRGLLRSRYGHLPGMDQLFTGGLAGFANGGAAGIVDMAFDRRSRRAAAEYGVDIDADDRIKRRLRLFEKALGKSESALNNERSAREQVMSSISSQLLGDIFTSSSSGSVFSKKYADGSVGATNANLAKHRDEALEFNRLQTLLLRRGVKGPALEALMEEGGLAAMRQFAAASDTEIRNYQSLYGQRGAAVQTASQGAAAVLGHTKAVRETTQEVRELKGAVKYLTKVVQKQEQDRKKDRPKQAARTGQAVAKAHDQTAKKAKGR